PGGRRRTGRARHPGERGAAWPRTGSARDRSSQGDGAQSLPGAGTLAPGVARCRRGRSAPAPHGAAARSPGRLRHVHAPVRHVGTHRQVVDHAAHARGLPRIIPRVARLHEVVHLAGEVPVPVCHVHLNSVWIDPLVLEQVLQHGVSDVLIVREAARVALRPEVVAHPRPAVRRRAAVPFLDRRLGRTVELFAVELAAHPPTAATAAVLFLVAVVRAALPETAPAASAAPFPALGPSQRVVFAVAVPADSALAELAAVLPEPPTTPPLGAVLTTVLLRAELLLSARPGAAAVQPIVA